MFVTCFRVSRSHLSKLGLRSLSSTSAASESSLPYFRTAESDPTKHDVRHLGRLYTVPEEDAKVLGDVPKERQLFLDTELFNRNVVFGEHTLMVRRPALEVTSYLKQIDFAKQPNARFVLWGKAGCGKSTTLSHLAHFCHASNFIVLNFHRFKRWCTHHSEVAQSEWKEGQWDLPIQSKNTLRDFWHINKDKLGDMKTHKTYKWSDRESTEEGSPLEKIIQQGLERPKFANDCLNVLMSELRIHCQESTCSRPVVTIIDGVNTLFEEKTYISKTLPTLPSRPRLERITPAYIEDCCYTDELSIVKSLRQMLRQDYNNAAVLTSVDRLDSLNYELRPLGRFHKWWRMREMIMVPQTQSDYPFALLGDAGWRHLDPFIPIQVDPYSSGELDTMIDYYVDKRYIREIAATDVGRQEIHFLTGRNPQDFFEYSNYW